MPQGVANVGIGPLVDRLRGQGERIRAKVRASTAAIIEIGRDLKAVKEHLPHGQFSAWVEAECGFTVRAAENYIRAADFAAGKNEIVSFLPATTLYAISAKSAAPDVVREVLVQAANGVLVPEREVADLLRRAAQLKRMEAAEARLTSRQRRARARVAKTKEAQREDWQAERAAAEAEAIETAQRLVGEIGASTAKIFLRETSNWLVRQHLEELVAQAPLHNDKVQHAMFGEGHVVAVEGRRLTIEFGGEVGRRVILDSFVASRPAVEAA